MDKKTILAFVGGGALVGGLVWMPLLLVGAGLYLGWGRRAS